MLLVALGVISVSATVLAFIFDHNTGKIKDEISDEKETFSNYQRLAKKWFKFGKRRIRNTLEQRIHQWKVHFQDIANQIEDISHKAETWIYGKSELSPHRRRALESEIRTINDSKYRARGYASFFEWFEQHFQDVIDGKYNDYLTPDNCLKGVIPDNYPYRGKILFIPLDQIYKEMEIAPYGHFSVMDIENLNLFKGNTELPIFVEKHSLTNGGVLHIGKGAIINEIIGMLGVGFDAVVKRLDPKQSLLEFAGLNFLLQKYRQTDPTRGLLRDSTLYVYPVEWISNLDIIRRGGHEISAEVTERLEESLNEADFEEVSLIVKGENLEELFDLFERNGDYDRPWLLQPEGLDPLSACDQYLLQNVDFVLHVKIEKVKGFSTFVLQNFAMEGERVKIEDPFVQFLVPLAVVSIDEYEYMTESQRIEWSEGFAMLQFFLRDELSRQRELLNANEGVIYYRRWYSLIQRLIQLKMRQGDDQPVFVESTNKMGSNWVLKIPDNNLLHQYIERKNDEVSEISARRAHFNLYKDFKSIGKIFPDYRDPSIFHLSAFDNSVRDEDLNGDFQIQLVQFPYPEIQQRVALSAFRLGQLVNADVKTLLLSPSFPSFLPGEPVVPEEINEPVRSNKYQREILAKVLSEETLFCIQGPPGTGKTTFIVELVNQTIKRNPDARILISSQTNIAVDEVMERLAKQGYNDKLIRIGFGVSELIEQLGIDLEARRTQYLEELKAAILDERLHELRNAWEKRLGNEMSPDVIETLVARHQIIGATCVGLARRRLGLTTMEFDLVVIDEAGRATPGEMIIPLLRAKKAILIGDHRQLPPTIDPLFLNENVDLGVKPPELKSLFAESLFERLIKGLPDSRRGLFRTQFRMPPSIGTIVSELFYSGEGGLENATHPEKPLLLEQPITWINPSIGPHYQGAQVDTSWINRGEVEIVKRLLGFILHLWQERKEESIDIAVITSYSEQKRQFEGMLNVLETLYGKPEKLNINVGTVDAFQGKQAEIVFYCLTRTSGTIRFLDDPHRINVALSRTRRELIIIGSIDFIRQHRHNGNVSCLEKLEKKCRDKNARILNLNGIDENALASLLREDYAKLIKHTKRYTEDSEFGRTRYRLHTSRNLNKLGVIDIGSRGVKLRVLDAEIYREKGWSIDVLPKLKLEDGQSVRQDHPSRMEDIIDGNGRIIAGRLEPLIQKLKQFREGLEANKVHYVWTFITGKFREATNCDSMLKLLEKRSGLNIRILKSEEEVKYNTLGALITSTYRGRHLVIDIGSASLEIGLGRLSRFIYRNYVLQRGWSLPMGWQTLAQIMLEEHEGDEISKIVGYLEEISHERLGDLYKYRGRWWLRPPRILVSGYPVRNRNGNILGVHGDSISRDELENLLDQALKEFGGLTIHEFMDDLENADWERKNHLTQCLSVIMGIPLLKIVLDKTGAAEIVINRTGLAPGVLLAGYHKALEKDGWQQTQVSENTTISV